jgi:hypothetical protein
MKEGAEGSSGTRGSRSPTGADRRARSIVCAMPPLASSGPIYIGAVVVPAALFLWWLLRAEAREAAAEADEEAAPAEHDQPTHDANGDRISAP